MKVLFDKYRPASQVAPPLNGAVWHQEAEDGKSYYFNVSGNPVDIETGEILSVTMKKPEPVVVETEVVTLDADGTMTTEKVTTEAEPQLDAKVELKKWLHGDPEAEKNWMRVRNFGKETFGKIASGKEELAAWGIDAGLVTAAELRPI